MVNMRDFNRIDKICDLLKVLWKKYPDQRLGQLLDNYVFSNGERIDKTNAYLFYQEDDETEKIILKKLYKISLLEEIKEKK